MARKLRFLPHNPTLVSITNRTVQGRYLLRPDLVLNDRLLGILGKFQRIHGVRIVMVTVLSTHYHIQLVVEDVLQQAPCMAILRHHPHGPDSDPGIPGEPRDPR